MKPLLVAVLVLGLVGCAGPAAVERMVAPAQEGVVLPLSSQVVLEPIELTFNLMPAGNVIRIGASELETALSRSLDSAGLLSDGHGRFGLIVIPKDLQHQDGVFELTVVAVIDYFLLERSTGQEVFYETIATSGTSELSEANAAADRMLFGAERAIAANFASLIEQLATLEF